MTSLLVKFEFQSKIKKVSIPKDQFTWINMCKVLSRTFSVPEDCIRLSYKDTDDDLITVCSDDDLVEAHNLISAKQTLKFYVNRNNSDKPENRIRGHEKDFVRANSLNIKENSLKNTLSVKKDYSEGQLPLEEKKINLPVVMEQPKPEVKAFDLSFEDIEQVLAKLFQTKEARQGIDQLRARIGLPDSSESKEEPKVNINIPEKQIADYISAAFMKALMEPRDDQEAVEKSFNEHLKSNSENSNQKDNSRRDLLDVSLKESIYNNSYVSSLKDKSKDAEAKSGSSGSFSRDLSSTHGVKLALKFENGKMKLMSIPMHEYSIIESAEDAKERAANNIKF